MGHVSIKYTNIFHCKTLQNLPKFGFLFWKQTIWQPWSDHNLQIFDDIVCCYFPLLSTAKSANFFTPLKSRGANLTKTLKRLFCLHIIYIQATKYINYPRKIKLGLKSSRNSKKTFRHEEHVLWEKMLHMYLQYFLNYGLQSCNKSLMSNLLSFANGRCWKYVGIERVHSQLKQGD
jgi:hypothetical protein